MKGLSKVMTALCIFQMIGGEAYGATPKPPRDFSKLMLVAGCRIHRLDGTYVREFPGNMCLFMKDGRYVSADAQRIVMYAPDKSQVWKIEGHYHHQLNWSEDGESILALSSKFIPLDGQIARVDVLQRISRNGKVTGSIASDEIYNTLEIHRERSPFSWESGVKEKAQVEISHFNSFHEIPWMKLKSRHKYMRAGNYIANSTSSGVVIIDKNLKIPLEKIQFPTSRDQTTHDVQVRTDGRILFLNNDAYRPAEADGPRSSVEFYDIDQERSTFNFKSDPPEMFYTPFSGGVQQIGEDLILISHVTNAFFFLDVVTKKVFRSGVLKNEFGVPNLTPTQQVKALDLQDFLKKW